MSCVATSSVCSAPRVSMKMASSAPKAVALKAAPLRAASAVSLSGRRVAAPQAMTAAPARAMAVEVTARGGGRGRGGRGRRDDGPEDPFEERLVQIRRVTKVVKGGKQLSFRAVVVAGDGAGQVGVGCAKAKEVMDAVRKAGMEARASAVKVQLSTKAKTLSHRAQAEAGGATVMLRPAAEGTGVIAGGAVRVVLELAGVKNCFGKQLGSPNQLNNARATINGLQSVRSFQEVAELRGLTVEELFA